MGIRKHTWDEQIIADAFNEFFVSKINTLKSNIDVGLVEEPLEKLKEKMSKKPKVKPFSLKAVSLKQVSKAISKLKNKSSSGIDGISQAQLIMGKNTLAGPITKIINQSIKEGVFPSNWKEALVTPVLKKGNPGLLENYRPVSCLPVASKVLEMIVCDQMTSYLETNNLLPNNHSKDIANLSCQT